jgi:hypothetical protein
MKMPMPFKLFSLTVLAALALSAADFRLSEKTKVGAVVLPAGQYSLSLRGSLAIIKDQESGKSVTTVVKSESGAAKFKETVVHALKENGEARVHQIEMGGSEITLTFD